MLGIMKAGGVYLPLDPEYPGERLKYMVEDAGVKVLLTRKSLRGLVEGHEGEEVYLDEGWEEIEAEADGDLKNETKPENGFCVIYTSGSTGKPKGVVARHKEFVNRIDGMWNRFPFEGDEVCCQKTGMSFVGVSVCELMVPMLRGVKVVIVGNEVVKDGQGFLRMLVEKKVTRVKLVPSLMKVLLMEMGEGVEGFKVRHWEVSGEEMPKSVVEEMFEKLPGSRLINFYGASEAGPDAIGYEAKKGIVGTKVPIGKPMSNVEVYILDRQMNVVPIGVPGEMYIGGEAAARGYVKKAGLTSEKFVPNPFSEKSGERMYRTGDLGRWLRDGNVEYLGRIDQQVKIRGFRIELGEIESAMSGYEGVKQAVVGVKEREGDKRLVGYYVEEKGKAVKVDELKGYLRGKLPEYMVPMVYVRLEEVPKTPSGKVDRKALPEPDSYVSEKEYVGPRDATEEALVGIWQEVLGVERVGIHDDFFEMGGHSLLATQMVSRVRNVFKVELSLKEMFENKTIAEMGRVVEEARAGGRVENQGAIELADRKERLELSYAQERLWFLDKYEPNSATYNIPYVLRMEGELKQKAH